jgi:hypothetical protein
LPVTVPSGSNESTIKVEVAPTASLGFRTIAITSVRGSGSKVSLAPLELLVLPPHYKRAASPSTDGQEAEPFSRIVRQIDRQQAFFLLIRPEEGSPFYLMENKVSNGMFAGFAKKEGRALEKSRWREGGLAWGRALGVENDRFPVFRVTRPEAARFAGWLGGRLPTAKQLDQAAGRARDPGNRLGVGRWRQGPLEVIEDSEGIHDLTGNGREWTRDDLRAGKETVAVLRGRSYAASIGTRTQPDFEQTQYSSHASPFTSFRVVLELEP